MDRFRVAVVIPAFNEAETIEQVIAVAKKFAIVIVINDCSNDETSLLAERAGALVIDNCRNIGYEQSLNEGVKFASKMSVDAVVTMDADGEHDANLLERYVELLKSGDVELVLGKRARKQRLAEIIMGAYVRLTCGPKDILCGFKGYTIGVINEHGWYDASKCVGTYLAISSIRNGYSYAEVSMDVSRRIDDPRYGATVAANFRILKALFRLIYIDISSMMKTHR